MTRENQNSNNDAEGKSEESHLDKPDTDFEDFKTLINIIYKAEKLDDIKPNITAHIEKIIKSNPISQNYTVLFLYDPHEDIRPYAADRIYKALSNQNNKNLLLIIHSSGGQIEPAYLISKCCKEYSDKFVVSVPRKAKSAATLLALGADEIHMGIMSELGPIDPQFGGLPALGLSSAVEYLAGLCQRYPESSEMFAKYLSITLNLRTLGYFERVSESAMQYAQRLLDGKELPQGQDVYNVAATFVYAYKDHSFVIDREEAKKFLGETIKSETNEYSLGNDIHDFLERLGLFIDIFKQHTISLIGTYNDLLFSEKKES